MLLLYIAKILKYRTFRLSVPKKTVTETRNIAKGKVTYGATVQKPR